MHTVSIQTTQPYAVHIGAGLLARSGELISAVTAARRCVLVTDNMVAPLYAKTVTNALERAGFTVFSYILPAGEAHKTLSACGELLSFFAACGLTRTDLAVSLGGGVVGDMTGFAAAVYQRGIDFIQMPTTLLAAVDASVGGKTAVDLPEGKNLAGAFHQPRLVICDTDTFRTLPAAVYSEGMAEVIKHALIADPELLRNRNIDDLVRRNVEIKASFVCGDEKEHGKRKILNFGHTIAHAIERCSGYTIPHGEAVAMGMMMTCRAGKKLGYTGAHTCDALSTLLKDFHLPAGCRYTADELFAAAAADKKRTDDGIHIVILREIGQPEILRIPFSDLRQWMEAAV